MNHQERIEYAYTNVENALDVLKSMFTESCKLTFIMRDTEYPDGWMLISDDDHDGIRDVVSRAEEGFKDNNLNT